MDFLINVPIYDTISTLLVVVDLFFKMMHLVPVGEKTEAADVASAFFQSMVKIYSLPSIIISNHDPHF